MQILELDLVQNMPYSKYMGKGGNICSKQRM